MNVIEVSDLRYRFGEFLAVAGVDFTVQRGEIFALLGTNGAGKTTTLEIIEGFRSPATGTVRVLGLDPARDRPTLSAKTGVMPQASGLIGELTPQETLRWWQGLVSRADDIEDVLSRVDLTHRRDVPVEKLSGGERRRLDFALAIWGEPPLVILDEPTTGLDPESRRSLWHVVEDLRAAGSTILLTTHYLNEAQALADHVAIMHAGSISIAGTLAEVLAAQPATITASLPRHISPPKLVGTVSVSGLSLRVETPELQEDLSSLLLWAAHNSVRLSSLTANPASLEQIFLSIGKE